MQTRLQSATEVIASTTIGMVGSWAISFATFSSIAEPAAAATVAVAGCTVWSLVRGYSVRRAFNARGHVATSRGTPMPKPKPKQRPKPGSNPEPPARNRRPPPPPSPPPRVQNF